MYETIAYNGWPNCIRLRNREIELIAATDIGPRIVHFGFIGGQNLFYLVPEQAGKTGGSEWRIYGGHRLWLAPEAIPFSYNPDNDPVELSTTKSGIRLRQKREAVTGVVKEMDIAIDPERNIATVVHRLINKNLHELEVAPWGLSMMAQHGRAIVPQEPYGEGDDYLLPARPLALWHFTKMNDPRWLWGARYIQAKQDPAHASEQKIGVLNKQGWAAYVLNDEIMIKKFRFDARAKYADFGCNNEIYINGKFLEIETLGPLTIIPADAMVEHTEKWFLTTTSANESEDSVDLNVLPLVKSF